MRVRRHSPTLPAKNRMQGSRVSGHNPQLLDTLGPSSVHPPFSEATRSRRCAHIRQPHNMPRDPSRPVAHMPIGSSYGAGRSGNPLRQLDLGSARAIPRPTAKPAQAPLTACHPGPFGASAGSRVFSGRDLGRCRLPGALSSPVHWSLPSRTSVQPYRGVFKRRARRILGGGRVAASNLSLAIRRPNKPTQVSPQRRAWRGRGPLGRVRTASSGSGPRNKQLTDWIGLLPTSAPEPSGGA